MVRTRRQAAVVTEESDLDKSPIAIPSPDSGNVVAPCQTELTLGASSPQAPAAEAPIEAALPEWLRKLGADITESLTIEGHRTCFTIGNTAFELEVGTDGALTDAALDELCAYLVSEAGSTASPPRWVVSRHARNYRESHLKSRYSCSTSGSGIHQLYQCVSIGGKQCQLRVLPVSAWFACLVDFTHQHLATKHNSHKLGRFEDYRTAVRVLTCVTLSVDFLFGLVSISTVLGCVVIAAHSSARLHHQYGDRLRPTGTSAASVLRCMRRLPRRINVPRR